VLQECQESISGMPSGMSVDKRQEKEDQHDCSSANGSFRTVTMLPLWGVHSISSGA
jgi:hypothetical protein